MISLIINALLNMNRFHSLCFFGFVCAIAICACSPNRGRASYAPLNEDSSPHFTNAVYYWKTTFALNEAEQAFLQRHQIDRIYMHMFDVAPEVDATDGKVQIVPIATTRFADKVPAGVEVVPTAYITTEALRGIGNEEIAEYATLIVERMRAMAGYNGCGRISEMQFDCDWTASTRETYFALCREAGAILHRDTIALSSTIRLHQLREEVPPVDRGVLMLYNTGSLRSPKTRNSILDIDDVKTYLGKKTQYPLRLDYAFPAFGWGIKFRDGRFYAIVSNPDAEQCAEGETIRVERPTAAEVLGVKTWVDSLLGKPQSGNILYHLDNSQLKYMTDDEIDKIYAYR